MRRLFQFLSVLLVLWGCVACRSSPGDPHVNVACRGPSAGFWRTLGVNPAHLTSDAPAEAQAQFSPVFHDSTVAVVALCESPSILQSSSPEIHHGTSALRVIQVATLAGSGPIPSIVLLFVPPRTGALSLKVGSAGSRYDITSPAASCLDGKNVRGVRVAVGAWVDVRFRVPSEFSHQHFIELHVTQRGRELHGVAYALPNSRRLHVTGPFWKPGRYSFGIRFPVVRNGQVTNGSPVTLSTVLPDFPRCHAG